MYFLFGYVYFFQNVTVPFPENNGLNSTTDPKNVTVQLQENTIDVHSGDSFNIQMYQESKGNWIEKVRGVYSVY